MAGRLLVVSNRLPLSIRKSKDGHWRSEPTSGGLQSAMAPILQRRGGVWIGWPGYGPRSREKGWDEQVERWRKERGYVAVDLPSDLARKFYQGYANQTLWPLFHSFTTRFDYDADLWAAYVAANRRFRDAVLEELEPGDTVWVHDYHLMLLPRMLREVAPETRIGFFLHIPFPASELLRILPRRDEVLRGLLGADLVAFQTHGDLQHFRASLLRLLGMPSQMDRVVSQGHSTRLDALPISIAPEELTGLLENDEATKKALADLRARYRGQRILLAVDRLDYTKGIPQRLRAFRKLLTGAPKLRGKVTLIQVAVPSREKIPEYEQLRHEVSALVGDVNGEFGQTDWTPIVFMRRGITRSELVALYAAADVGWVTPLRDGMNLVAKEYVACHRGADGALLLSEFAGAAAEMGEAFLVNPYDEERTAGALERVLALPVEDRQDRMAQLYRRVQRNNVFRWADRFLSMLDTVTTRRVAQGERPDDLPVAEAVEAFKAASRRLLLLDYDGTLVPYADRPREAIPPAHVLSLLATLAAHPGVTLAVVSGRSRADLERWFGRIDKLWLIAEHGAAVRPPGKGWELVRGGPPPGWKAKVLPLLEHYLDRTPGSLIEEKEFALVWHHRLSDPEFGEWLANELVATLDEMLADTELQAIRGQKTVEVRLVWANKGSVLDRLEAENRDATFRLAMGDDRTDEDLFERMRERAWTVRVGEGRSMARHSVRTPAEVCAFLDRLAQAGAADRASQPAVETGARD